MKLNEPFNKVPAVERSPEHTTAECIFHALKTKKKKQMKRTYAIRSHILDRK